MKKNLIIFLTIILIAVLFVLFLMPKDEINKIITNIFKLDEPQTEVSYNVYNKYDDEEKMEVCIIIKNENKLEKITLDDDIAINCAGKTQIAFDRILKKGEIIHARLKVKGIELEEEHEIEIPWPEELEDDDSNYDGDVKYKITVNDVELKNWNYLYEKNGTSYLIYGGYLPNETGIAQNSGLIQDGTYTTYINTSRQNLINILNNTENWDILLTEKMKEIGAKAKGGLTIEEWVEIWNSKRIY